MSAGFLGLLNNAIDPSIIANIIADAIDTYVVVLDVVTGCCKIVVVSIVELVVDVVDTSTLQ